MQTIHINDIQPLSQRTLGYTTVCVVLLHAFLFLWMYIEPSATVSVKRSRKEHVTVSTVSLNPKPVVAEKAAVAPSKQVAAAPQKAEKPVVAMPVPTPASPKPVKKAAPAPKPVAKKTTAPKKVVAKSKPTTAPILDIAQEKQKNLLLKAQASLSQMKSTSDKTVAMAPTTSSLPRSIQTLQSEMVQFDSGEAVSSQEMTYREEVAGRLRLFLKLPEYGAVKIKLVVERSGKVAKVTIVSAESATNKKYIEKTVPTLTFPVFGDNFGKLSEYTFQITLNNDV